MRAQPHVPLKGRTALITGAANRLGRALAIALASDGASVVIHYRESEDAALALVKQLASSGVGSWAVKGDLSDPAAAEAVFARAVEAAGSIDILVNNASIFPESRLSSVTVDEIASTLNVNALSPLVLSRAFAAAAREGDIVNLLDCRMVDHDPAHAAYQLSKRMLFSLTRMMALELAPGIKVNAVAPGLILPPPGKDQRYLESLAGTNPLHRIGAPEEVADAVLFLIRSRFVTGQVIYVDGGRHMKGCVFGT